MVGSANIPSVSLSFFAFAHSHSRSIYRLSVSGRSNKAVSEIELVREYHGHVSLSMFPSRPSWRERGKDFQAFLEGSLSNISQFSSKLCWI